LVVTPSITALAIVVAPAIVAAPTAIVALVALAHAPLTPLLYLRTDFKGPLLLVVASSLFLLLSLFLHPNKQKYKS
jgi:hypothetical protein